MSRAEADGCADVVQSRRLAESKAISTSLRWLSSRRLRNGWLIGDALAASTLWAPGAERQERRRRQHEPSRRRSCDVMMIVLVIVAGMQPSCGTAEDQLEVRGTSACQP